MDQITQYITTQRQAGFTDEQIKQALLQAGHMPEQVERYYEELAGLRQADAQLSTASTYSQSVASNTLPIVLYTVFGFLAVSGLAFAGWWFMFASSADTDSGAETGVVTTFDCYDPANIGTVGQVEPCEGMLIVDREMVLGAENLDFSGEDRVIRYDNIDYTFGDSEYNIFTGQVTDMSKMFYESTSFNAPINYWDVSNVTSMSEMFYGAFLFNQPLNDWDVSSVTDMSSMHSEAFNQPLDSWDVSSVTDMSMMFSLAPFNQPINSWNVSNVTDMTGMFIVATEFNQPLDSWDVSNVTSFSLMFTGAESFNQPLNSWTTSNVTDMNGVFNGAVSFNHPLNDWDVSNVTEMNGMFASALSFDQAIDKWNTENVIDMNGMFARVESFNQNLSCWNVINIENEPGSFAVDSSFDPENHPQWGTSGC